MRLCTIVFWNWKHGRTMFRQGAGVTTALPLRKLAKWPRRFLGVVEQSSVDRRWTAGAGLRLLLFLLQKCACLRWTDWTWPYFHWVGMQNVQNQHRSPTPVSRSARWNSDGSSPLETEGICRGCRRCNLGGYYRLIGNRPPNLDLHDLASLAQLSICLTQPVQRRTETWAPRRTYERMVAYADSTNTA